MLRWIKLALLVYSIGLFSWIGYQMVINVPEVSPVRPTEAKLSSQRPLHIEGLDYSTYDGEQAVSRVRAERFEVRPRKFGVFRLKSLNEVFFKKLRLVVFALEQARERGTANQGSSMGELLAGSLSGLTQMRNLGRIQRVVMEGFEFLTVVSEQRQLKSVVRSRQAVFDIRKKELKLEHAKVELFALKRRLTATQLVWDERDKLWLVNKQATLWAHGEKMMLERVRLNEFLELVE